MCQNSDTTLRNCINSVVIENSSCDIKVVEPNVVVEENEVDWEDSLMKNESSDDETSVKSNEENFECHSKVFTDVNV